MLRRRTTSSTSAEQEPPSQEALTAPLLAREEIDDDDDDDDDDDALALVAPSSSSPSLAALLWQHLVACPVAAAISILSPFLPPRWRPLHLSENTQRALDALRQDAAEPFDPLSPEHEADLRRLWAASFGGRETSPSPSPPPPETSPPPYPPGGKSPLWKRVGWQGEDPRTDLRGAGRGALTAALHMSREQPLLWARLRDKRGRRESSNGTGSASSSSSSWVAPEGLEYPFGAAGVNVAFMVAQVAGLHSHDAVSGAAATAAGAASRAPSSSSSSSSSLASSPPAPAAGSVSKGGRGRGPAPSRGPPKTAAAKGFAALLAASVPEGGEESSGPSSSPSSAAAAAAAAAENDENDNDNNTDPHSVALRLRAWRLFGDVYCAAFEALDEEWCSRKASYLDFPLVMAETRRKLEAALGSRRADDAREALRRELRRQK